MSTATIKRVTPSVQGPCTHDSYVLTIKTDCNFHPDGWSSLPEPRTFGMRRVWAEELAVKFNRDALERDTDHWAVVVYWRKGFYVLQIVKPKNWNPTSEYELPPDIVGPFFNMEARQNVREENFTRLLSGNWKTWSVHVKPLRRASERDLLPLKLEFSHTVNEPAPPSVPEFQERHAVVLIPAGCDTDSPDESKRQPFEIHFYPDGFTWEESHNPPVEKSIRELTRMLTALVNG